MERFKKFYHLMLDGGVYLPPSPVEAFFLSSAHSAADIEKTVGVAARALKQIA
jgi:glutamate-1-semialdehyde 2,1-aminomutase